MGLYSRHRRLLLVVVSVEGEVVALWMLDGAILWSVEMAVA